LLHKIIKRFKLKEEFLEKNFPNDEVIKNTINQLKYVNLHNDDAGLLFHKPDIIFLPLLKLAMRFHLRK
jgi:hypothetical protein